MKPVYDILAVGLGGAIGSILRYAIAFWSVGRFGPGFPWHTLAVNVVGSFLIGVFAVYARSSVAFSPYVSTFLIVGVLGGFTTFSTFSYDTLTLLSESAPQLALAYCGGSVAAGIAAAMAGMTVARVALRLA